MQHRVFGTDGRIIETACVGVDGSGVAVFIRKHDAVESVHDAFPAIGDRRRIVADLLPSAKPSQRAALARQYAAEALADLTGVTVENARVTPTETGLNIRVDLIRQGEALSVELEESV